VVVLANNVGVNMAAPLAGSVAVNGGSAQTVPVAALSPRRLVFTLVQKYPPGTKIRYSITTATLSCTGGTLPLTDESVVLSNAEAIPGLLDKIAYSKTSDEKDVFASFVAARGENGNVAGAADIVVNRDLTQGRVPTVGSLFDTAYTTFRIRKTSAENADPRAFDASVTLQKTRVLGAAGTYLVACSRGLTQDCIDARKAADDGRGFFRAFLFNEAIRLESDAFSFESVNFVSDTQLQLGSQAKAVTDVGYLSVRLHAGAEIGRSLQKPTTATGTSNASTSAVDWIRRGKGGGEMTFRFLPRDNTGNSWAVEMSARAVVRHLFADETFIEQVTNADHETVPSRVSLGTGTKMWREVDAKVFLFSNANARYGVRVAYMNGSLPPTFKPTKGFTFGFIVESADDTSSGKPANAAP
jgi:hypothetical protein